MSRRIARRPFVRRPVAAGTPVWIEPLEVRRLFTFDLTIAVTTNIGAYKAGLSGITGNLEISNNGNTTVTTDFSVEGRLSLNNVFGDSDDVGSVTVPVTTDITPNPTPGFGGYDIPFGFNIPANVPAAPYNIVLKIDSTNKVAETNENNNTTVARIGVVTGADGIVPVWGTESGDSITVTYGPGHTVVNVNGTTTQFLTDQISGFAVLGFGGNDTIVFVGNLGPVTAWAGDGDDTIAGSEGHDTLSGGAGKDRIFGGLGNDRLNGNGGHDRLFGEAGADRLYGYAGNDYLDGGSSGDRFYGDAGTDVFYGQSGNDKFYCNDGVVEYIYGASGTDLTENDIYDYFISCEGFL